MVDWQGLLMSIDPYLYPGLTTFLMDKVDWWGLLRFLIHYIIVKFICVILNLLLPLTEEDYDVTSIRNEQKTLYIKYHTWHVDWKLHRVHANLGSSNIQFEFHQSRRDRSLDFYTLAPVDKSRVGYPRYTTITSSNGMSYIRLTLTGSLADIQMAVKSIQDLVGIDNLEENIELPSNSSQMDNRMTTIDDNHIGIYKKTLYVNPSVGERLEKAQDMIDRKGFQIDLQNIKYVWVKESIFSEKKKRYETITASNGVKYIPVHLKGSDKDIKKAVALIQKQVGIGNVEETIDRGDHTIEEGTTIYIKAPARRNLKIGTIIKKTPVYSIDAERSTVKASNGETYVLVHIKGSEETKQKAIALIQKDVGMDNVVETIELPVDPDVGDIADRRASSVCQSQTLYVKSSTVQRNLR